MLNTKLIYMDNAATTRVSDQVLEAMTPYLQEEYGNPSSIYSLGRRASLAVEQSRDKIAAAINAKSREIFFTSGGSESDNWALKSGAKMQAQKGKNHIVSINIEHHAVLHTLNVLKRDGYEVTLVPVEVDGIVKLENLKKAIRPETGLVSVMYANNEIGTIQPIAEIGKFCRENDILFHTDAVQAVGQVEIDVVADNIDMLSSTAHKLHGPKGSGFLYVRQGLKLPNLIDGGAQERGHRAGTENVSGIVGLATAVEHSTKNIKVKTDKMRAQSQHIMDELLKIERTRLNGDRSKRLANNVNISFEGIEGESILLLLDNAGIAASSGSACTSGSLDPSHVLLALGLPHEIAHGSLRISLSEYTTDEEVEYLIKTVPGVVKRLREMSPLWETITKNN